MIKIDLSVKLSEMIKLIKSVKTLAELNEINLKLITGKNSLFNSLSKDIKSLKLKDRRVFGIELNKLKSSLLTEIDKKKQELLNRLDEEHLNIDITLPIKPTPIGKLSPDTQVIRMMNEFFIYHGFSIAEGPEIETDEFNFEKTNLPKDHPARDLQDTIYLKSPEILLRTHTSSVETRILTNFKPPLRFVVPGVSYRNEILNQSNHAIFYQYQGVVVDRNISMANLIATLNEFAKYMFGSNIKTRFRTKYYPEVEPGAGMDIICAFCHGKGCGICKGRGWLEILGSGIIHRELLKKCGINYKKWSGFAFGMGLDRIIMSKYNIDDIRELHSGNLVPSE